MPKVTKAQLDRYSECRKEMTELGRRVRSLESEVKSITALALADLEASPQLVINRGGYRIEYAEGKLSVSWKDELVSRLGAEVADAITKAVGTKKVLQITPPATAPTA